MQDDMMKLAAYKNHTIFFNPEKRNFVAINQAGQRVEGVSYQSLCAKITQRREKIFYDEKLKNGAVTIRASRFGGTKYKTGTMTGHWKKDNWGGTTVEINLPEQGTVWLGVRGVYIGDATSELNKLEQEYADAQLALNKFTGTLCHPKLV